MLTLEILKDDIVEPSSWLTTTALQSFGWYAAGTISGIFAVLAVLIETDPAMDNGPYSACVIAGGVGGAMLAKLAKSVPVSACIFWGQRQEPEPDNYTSLSERTSYSPIG